MNSTHLRIGVISDTHLSKIAPNSAFTTAISAFLREKVDYVFHLGDFTDWKVYQELTETFGDDKVHAVRGNMDAMDPHIPEILPESKSLVLSGRSILLVHGWGGPLDMIERITRRFDLSQVDLVVFGHTHRNLITNKHQRWYFNPGKCQSGGSYGIIDIDSTEITPRIIQM
ncbi:MAG: YfcE family phosphodiesterase [Promethearchaeota archaeon]|nr:MAG: YfcE family phosphodiesterase [Candidatus Lokiarchaeota archaeon]